MPGPEPVPVLPALRAVADPVMIDGALAWSLGARLADLGARVDALEGQLTTLTGQIETDGNRIRKIEDALKAYDAGGCTAYVTALSGLEGERRKLKAPEDHVMLPEVISKDPLGPVVRQGDEQWLSIVRWSLFALIHAEEVGITSQNIDAWIAAGSPVAREFSGAETGPESGLGIDPRWAYLIVKAIGNYGEMFERNLGKGSKLGIERGINALWNAGGLLYVPPVR